MLIIPAIDLLNGKVVRLEKGDMEKFKVYSDDPVAVAKSFEDMGVKRLHIVDLNGAKDGALVNFTTIEKIVSSTKLSVDVGGGIRDLEKAGRYVNLGVDYITLGTIVIKNVGVAKEIIEKYPGRVILGIDAKDGFVATDGWYEKSDKKAIDVINEYKGFSVNSVIYTDISRDGMLSGINVDATVKLSEISPFPVIASGGLKGEEDILELSRKNVYGCIVGKAYYEGLVNLKKIIKMLS
ncbi:MAG: 1-(5-phosphoribosyl)-5-[(5-phosphoribosylamino)methylideneamino]imidazole-4-carboxamide isomerase [Deferribacterales bacterium]